MNPTGVPGRRRKRSIGSWTLCRAGTLSSRSTKKHGACSGLHSAAQHFNAAREAYGKVHIPEQFQDPSKAPSLCARSPAPLFLDASRQLSDDMIQARMLKEAITGGARLLLQGPHAAAMFSANGAQTRRSSQLSTRS